MKLGSDLGLDVWVARNDRTHNGVLFQDIPNLRRELPRQFDDATNKTIELIDVLWLESDAIIAAFEMEHTTAIYSGLLRMSDMQIGSRIRYMKPEFISEIAESCEPDYS